ncbi:MAG TPA: hypothetical protein VFG38_07280 [Pseudomonadales bacterium]|nr:hypothetical protein [Pseudomonadales bacterium]
MKRYPFVPTILLGGAVALASNAWAESDVKPNEHIRLDETVISGNQELPKVLYIVPWQDPTGIPKIELDPNFTEHEVFRQLYPPTYKRELEYYDALKAAESKE